MRPLIEIYPHLCGLIATENNIVHPPHGFEVETQSDMQLLVPPYNESPQARAGVLLSA